MKIDFPFSKTTGFWTTLICCLLVLPPSMADSDFPGRHNDDQKVFPVTSKPYGSSYGEWAAKWWQWEFSLPYSVNPWFDSTGERAGIGQSGKVFFLTALLEAGVVNRQITVPADKALFFPLINSWCDNVDVTPTVDFPGLQSCAAATADGTSELHASIDGRPLAHLTAYRVKSPPFCTWLPPTDNVYQVVFHSAFSGWSCPVASDGYWLMLAPLSAGHHTVNFGGTSGPFGVDVTYQITVMP